MRRFYAVAPICGHALALHVAGSLSKMGHAFVAPSAGSARPNSAGRHPADLRKQPQIAYRMGGNLRRHLPLPLSSLSRLFSESPRIHRADAGGTEFEIHERTRAASQPRTFRQRFAHERRRILATAAQVEPAGVSSHADSGLRPHDGGVHAAHAGNLAARASSATSIKR